MLAIAIAALMTGSSGADPGSEGMDNFQVPPWSATAEEKAVSDHASFAVCDQLISTFVAKLNGKLKDQSYSVSDTWGAVLRVKVTDTDAGFSYTTDVVCWSKPGAAAEVAVRIEDP